MNYQTIQSTTMFNGRVFSVRKDLVHTSNGKDLTFDVVEHAGAVTIIPVDDTDQVWLVRQYRHAIQKDLLELPAGVMDASEPPQTSAQRELREEIGMAAETLEPLGAFYLAPGYSTEYMYVFLASGLQPAPLQPDEDENIQIEKYPRGQIGQLIETGQIQDAKSLAALYLWKLSSDSSV